jgi:y4mF family transcriptional regulator
MLVRAPLEIGALIRDRRERLKLDQATFAKRIGVSRYWIIRIEKGHPRAELGLVLRALDQLNIRLDAKNGGTKHHPGAVDIDAIVANAKKIPPRAVAIAPKRKARRRRPR